MEGIRELDQSVEILIRLLCAVPGWREKNVQVRLLLPILGLLFRIYVPPALIRITIASLGLFSLPDCMLDLLYFHH